MDDDDLRRGQPACHKKFGEAMAILAGDALIVLAFELLTRGAPTRRPPAELVRELCEGAGWSGMIGGQAADVLELGPPTIEQAQYIHERKTASLFRTACRLGAMIGNANPVTLAALGRYGEMLGRAFQITDDLLDVTSTTAVTGKTTGKDAGAGKQTLPQCVGVERSRAMAAKAVEAACAELAGFGAEAGDLRALGAYVLGRTS